MDYEFWMVWGEGTHRVTCQHYSERAAMAEAERLAAQNPGQNFFVLRAVQRVRLAITESVMLMKREGPPS